MGLFEAKLRELMTAEKITLTAVAKIIGTSVPYVHQVVNGSKNLVAKRRMKIIETYPQLSEFLNPLDKVNAKD